MKVTERDMDLEDDDSVPTVQSILREAEDIGIVDVSNLLSLKMRIVVGRNDRFVLTDVEIRSPLFPEKPRC